jgi:FKBP-type peptidyl-prolyl cis-trans isomerase 2
VSVQFLTTFGSSSSPTVKAGDNVTIDYILTFTNGTVMDTSFKQVALDGGIYNSARNYVPYAFTVGSDMVIPGISDAVIGMKVNETKNGTITADKAYGVYNSSDIRPSSIRAIEGDNNTLKIGQALLYSPDGVHYKYCYVVSIDAANDTVYLDYNHRLAGLAFDYQITVRSIS